MGYSPCICEQSDTTEWLSRVCEEVTVLPATQRAFCKGRCSFPSLGLPSGPTLCSAYTHILHKLPSAGRTDRVWFQHTLYNLQFHHHFWTDSTGSEVIFPSSHPPSTSLACLSSASQATASKIRPWCLLPLSKKAVLSPRSPVLSCPSLNTLSLHSSPPDPPSLQNPCSLLLASSPSLHSPAPLGCPGPPTPPGAQGWLAHCGLCSICNPPPHPLASPTGPPSLAILHFCSVSTPKLPDHRQSTHPRLLGQLSLHTYRPQLFQPVPTSWMLSKLCLHDSQINLGPEPSITPTGPHLTP